MAIISMFIDPHTIMEIGKVGNDNRVTIIKLGKIQTILLNRSPMLETVNGTVKQLGFSL